MTTPTPPTPSAPHEGSSRSYLLQVQTAPEGLRFRVQDLKTGERHDFESDAELRRFIAERGRPGLR